MKFRVLFLCATNSVQSPMAEALLKGLDPEHFEVLSAGIHRRETHPLTVEVMKEIRTDLTGRVTKAVADVLNSRFDFVISLGDRAKLQCPEFPEAEIVHWQFDDPLLELDPDKQKRRFRSLRDQIAQRVRLFALVQTRFASIGKHAYQDPHSRADLIHT